MKNTSILIAVVTYLFIGISCGYVYAINSGNCPEQEIKILYIENVDEMEDTPEEIYIHINGKMYMYSSITGDTTVIAEY